MSNQSLIIYKFEALYHILSELNLDINFKIINVDSEDFLKNETKNQNNCLIISNKENLDNYNQIVINNFPLNIFKLIEKINIEFLKIQFSNQSEFKINNYIINLNSREIINQNTKLKLTEKEINTIIYLFKIKSPVTIDELQRKVWSYQSNIETHTVETHIYRLRKKMFKTFNDESFLISKKNGYQIK